jgi:hypothetical protein
MARQSPGWPCGSRTTLVDDSRPPLPDDYVARLDELIVAGRRGDAVEYFMTTAIGLPPEFVTPMRDMPMWQGMEAVAHTLPYHGQVVAVFALPITRLRSLAAPTLVLDGGQTPWTASGVRALVDALPDPDDRTLEGQLDALTLWGIEHAREAPLAGEPVHAEPVMIGTKVWLNAYAAKVPDGRAGVWRFPGDDYYTLARFASRPAPGSWRPRGPRHSHRGGHARGRGQLSHDPSKRTATAVQRDQPRGITRAARAVREGIRSKASTR